MNERSRLEALEEGAAKIPAFGSALESLGGAGLAAARLCPALEEIAQERARQIAVEGWTPEHDDEHRGGGLAFAAAAYAVASTFNDVERRAVECRHGSPAYVVISSLWPWAPRPRERRSRGRWLMLFTVGDRVVYEQGLRDRPSGLFKLGVRRAGEHLSTPQGYGGGIVFEAAADAQAYLDRRGLSDFAVFGLETDLANTYELCAYRFLIADARIVAIDASAARGDGSDG